MSHIKFVTVACKLVLISAETAPALEAPSQNPLKIYFILDQGYPDRLSYPYSTQFGMIRATPSLFSAPFSFKTL